MNIIHTLYIIAVTPPLEPPLLDFTSPGGLEDELITVYISARPVRNMTIDVLAITVTGLPAMATLSKGSRMDDGTWRITEDEFGSLELSTSYAFFQERYGLQPQPTLRIIRTPL